MRFIFLSPHLDDATFSCGGYIWEQTQNGHIVEIWTLFAGDSPPGRLSHLAKSLHKQWELDDQAYTYRRLEDQASTAEIGAVPRHFDIPEAIYRRHPVTDNWQYRSTKSLFGAVNPSEKRLGASLIRLLKDSLPTYSQVVCPLALGKHVDHQLVRAAAEALSQSLWYYADLPYTLDRDSWREARIPEGWQPHVHQISDNGLAAWQKSIAAHTSQIGTFWPNVEAMNYAIREYWSQKAGIQLWQNAQE